MRREQAKLLDGAESTFEVEIQPVGRPEQVRLLISASPVTDDRGVVQSILGTCLDISERSKVERALAESESRLRMIMGQMPTFLWTTDRALRYTFALGRSSERGMALSLGRTVEQVLGSRSGESIGVTAHWRALQGESVTFEHTFDDRVYQLHVEPLRDGDGAISGTIGVSLDITERKSFEARLCHLASRDPLTDLFNRRRFEEELDREVDARQQQRRSQRAPLVRPRPLQGDQRHARAPRRRSAPDPRRQHAASGAADRRDAGPARRRRVRRAGPRRRPPRGRAAGQAAARGGQPRSARGRRPERSRHRVDRRGGAAGRRRHRRRGARRTPTSPCTRPSARAATATRCSRSRTTCAPCWDRSSPPPRCCAPACATIGWCSTCSRSSSCAPARWRGGKRWCACRRPTARCSNRRASSPSPSDSASPATIDRWVLARAVDLDPRLRAPRRADGGRGQRVVGVARRRGAARGRRRAVRQGPASIRPRWCSRSRSAPRCAIRRAPSA